MKYYAVAEIDITDRSWVSAYVKNGTPMVERYGGRYLARTPRISSLSLRPPRSFATSAMSFGFSSPPCSFVSSVVAQIYSCLFPSAFLCDLCVLCGGFWIWVFSVFLCDLCG
jgi:hypothetical protein